jgi:hypothetical protein
VDTPLIESLLRPGYRVVLRAVERARVAAMRARGMSTEPVVVLGSPRSGTSWLMRLIARPPGYCTIFEPLHHRWWPEARAVGFGGRPWDADERQRKYLEEVFRGEKGRRSIRKPRWSEAVGGNPVRLVRGILKRLRADRLVVKFVRACRLLPWLVDAFPGCRYVYIVRSPYAVVSSQLSRGASSYLDDRPVPYDYLNAEKQSGPAVAELCDRIRTDAAQVLGDAIVRDVDSLEGALTVSWYADNLIAQEAAARSEAVCTVRYEDLLTRTESELRTVRDHIGGAASLAAGVEVKNPERQLRKWRQHLSGHQEETIRTVLEALQNEYGALQ